MKKLGFIQHFLSSKKHKLESAGFTLIEIIIVISIVGIVLPAFFSIIYTIFRQQARVVMLNEVKEQGDHALSTIENVLLNSAGAVYDGKDQDGNDATPGKEICNDDVSIAKDVKYFVDKSDSTAWFRFYPKDNAISSQSATLDNGAVGEVDLTTSKVEVSNFSIQCTNKSSFTKPVLSIKFDISYKTTSTNPQEKTTLKYQTKVKLRE